MNLAASDFAVVRDLVYRKTGLMFEDRKRDFVQTRVGRRAAAVGCRNPHEYVTHLRLSDDGSELQSLIEELTTNETYFFRDYPQLTCFANEVLPLIVAPKRATGEPLLHLWSAACSTGDEPYTLAIILRACLDDFRRWQIRLLATDIDRHVLAVAKRAVYSERAVQDVPSPYLRQFFRKIGAEYHLDDAVRRMVTFLQLNLMDEAVMRQQRRFDCIFCRNVLIYFDDDSRRRVLDWFYEALVPGGFLFLGHSESVSRISAAYESMTLDGNVVYRKPPVTRAVSPTRQRGYG